jgi:Na+/melibiose symporter-like transporter
VFTEGVCKLLNLIISDLVDEDYTVNRRTSPIAALIFGSLSLVAKPGQTLAPLLGTMFLSAQTGIDLFISNSPLSDDNNHDLKTDKSYQFNCLQVLIIVPIACSLLQLIIWQKFDLHSGKLKKIKEVRLGSHRTDAFII